MSLQSECSVLDRQPEAPDLRLTNSFGDVSIKFARAHLCAYHRTILAPLLSTSFTTCFQNDALWLSYAERLNSPGAGGHHSSNDLTNKSKKHAARSGAMSC